MTFSKRVLAMWILFGSVAMAYSGDTIGAADGKGHFAVVRNDDGRIVWQSNKKQSEKKAQKKADAVATEMNDDDSFMDECNGPPEARPDWCR